ncbi:DNA polymerase delta small subunit Cdc1 [Thecaphora frezii]
MSDPRFAPLQRRQAASTDVGSLAAPFVVPLGSRSYSKQFAQLYDYRLVFLKKRILARAHKKWVEGFEAFSQSQSQSQSQGFDDDDDDDDDRGANQDDGDDAYEAEAGPSRPRRMRITMAQPPTHVDRILDVQQGDVCYIVGNLYCSMPLKPDVLEDLTREQWLAPQPTRAKFVDAARDELFIEDQSGRVKLVGDAIRPDGPLRPMLLTGAVVAVLGTETRAGDFEVVDAVFAGLPDQPGGGDKAEGRDDKPMQLDGDGGGGVDAEDRWVVIMSGLCIGGQESLESEMAMQLLTEWLTGELGQDEDRAASAKVVAAVIAGNSMAPPVRNEDETKTRRFGQGVRAYSSAPTLALDEFLTDLCSSMPVHLLPGERDPASVAMPQQPIHFALLPRAGRFDSLHRHTNPAWIGLDGRTLLGTSGQNVDDIFKYVTEGDEDRIRMACSVLEWGHLAPTAPDTLWCYPFKATDPFVIRQRPDVLFIGNQPAYATALYHFDEDDTDADADAGSVVGKACRVVLVPEFAKTQQVVLLNLASLESKVVQVRTAV